MKTLKIAITLIIRSFINTAKRQGERASPCITSAVSLIAYMVSIIFYPNLPSTITNVLKFAIDLKELIAALVLQKEPGDSSYRRL